MTRADEIINCFNTKMKELGIEERKKQDTLPTDRQLMIDFIIKNFKVFNPLSDDIDKLPKAAGNYVFLLKKGIPFPIKGIRNIPIVREITLGEKEYQLIYTGIVKPTSTASNLQKRIGKQHFGENAGRSTLRLSLGSLMGFTKIFRDSSQKHLKFKKTDEQKLTDWMQNSLIVLYYVNYNCGNDEENMISALNPPLNLDKNHCCENAEFRSELSNLRSKRTQFEPITENK